jgi:hypothetical protein
VQVGGDEWNKATASRLEREYQAARPLLDSLTRDAVKLSEAMGGVVTPVSEDDEDAPYYPESWDELSNVKQQEVEDAYVEDMTPKFLQDEVDNWYSSGNATDDAKVMLAHDAGETTEWFHDAIDGFVSDSETRIPFTVGQLQAAITLNYEGGYEGQGDLEVEFDDSVLDSFKETLPQLPGFEAPEPSKLLTETMRDDLTKAIEKAFDKEADEKSGSMDAPEYLNESASEYAGDYFSQMTDKEKFEWAYENDKVDKPDSETKDAPPENKLGVEALPETFDPLNETSGAGYKRTQQLARFLSVARANEIIVERGLRKTSVDAGRLAAIDHTLWDSWKGSSTSDNGMLLQVATAEELGGRLNTKTATGIPVDDLKSTADHRYADIGGYAGIKAYVRAKWETTQYLLDRAGEQELELYRGIDLKRYDPDRYAQAVKEKGVRKQVVTIGGGKTSGALTYEKAPTVKVDRNGAASATTDPSIANEWKGPDTVVLRALVPRTAAISVPAYGINIHSEHEVVIAGTAWKAWDAWLGKAPLFDMVPIGERGTGIGTSAPKLAEAA